MSIYDSNSSAVNMSPLALRLGRWAQACVLAAGLLGCSAAYAAETATKAPAAAAVPAGIDTFNTPEQAASAIVAAAQSWDTAKLSAMLIFVIFNTTGTWPVPTGLTVSGTETDALWP